MLWLPLLLALFAFAGEAYAAPCTDGTDCYCDCVNGPATGGTAFKNASCAIKGAPVDSSVLLCEDFELGTYRDARGTGADGKTGPGTVGTSAECNYANLNADTANCYGYQAAPFWGPWYETDTSVDSGFTRGSHSAWYHNYGKSGGGFRGDDPTYVLGDRCGITPGNPGADCNSMEWRADSAWGGVPRYTIIDIIRNGEFDDEDAAITPPLLPGGGSGVFDGRQTIGHRVGPYGGADPSRSVAGFHGVKSFGSNRTSVGVTQAVAFPANVVSTGIFGGNGDSAWKPNEWAGPESGSSFENPQIGNTTVAEMARRDASGQPYYPFLFHNSQSACTSSLNAATQSIGNFACSGSALRFWSDSTGPNAYNQATDWPWGTWACPSMQQTGKGTSNFTWRIWHNDLLIGELTNFDSVAGALRFQSYDNFYWNNYSNVNENAPGTSSVTYRYEDNVHITNGAPVSCAQIGLGAVTPGTDRVSIGGQVNFSGQSSVK